MPVGFDPAGNYDSDFPLVICGGGLERFASQDD
jgi:hypothetical protein